MTDEIRLGSLAITGEELFKACRVRNEHVIPGETDSYDALAMRINDVLREKIAKCPRVWGHEDRDFGVMVYFDDEEAANENTHTARLVCIEERKDE